jgi:hypothetical protein
MLERTFPKAGEGMALGAGVGAGVGAGLGWKRVAIVFTSAPVCKVDR